MLSDQTSDYVPNHFAKHKHTRRAFEYGYFRGIESGQMLNPAELRDWIESGPIERELAESIESEDWQRVGHWQATESRDTGSARGLSRLERLEEIAESGCVASDLCDNGDSAILESWSNPVSSGIVSDGNHLLGETMDAYDAGYAQGFAETVDN